MKKIIKFGLMGWSLLLVFVFFSTIAQALTINVDLLVSPEVYPGDSNFFSYTISSNENVSLIYAPYVTCPNAPLPPIEYLIADISPNQPIEKNYNQFYVESSYTPQTCQAVIEIISPVYLVKKQSFEIKTESSLDIQIFSCKDLTCLEKSKVFVKGEKVYLDYSSEIKNISLKNVLIYPDNEEETIALPSTISPNQIGTYTLRVNAEKEGYLTTKKTIQFGVIEKEAETQNYFAKTKLNYIYIILIVAAAGIIIYFLKFRKPKDKYQILKAKWKRR